MKKYYHATDAKNLVSIIENGIKVSIEGIVYLAETKEDAYKFVFLRQYEETLVIEVELDESKVKEQFDHNFNFFACRAFGYSDDIPFDATKNKAWIHKL